MTGNQIERWADKAMFSSEQHNAAVGPIAHLLGGPNDPLGQIAACGKMYLGEVVRDLADVTDEERRYYAEQMKLTKLKMPLEAVSLHFMLENVTRAFTHQLVRQRTAAYAQESMRFAVVEDMNEAVALPPSLAAFNDPEKRAESLRAKVEGGYPRNETERQFWVWVQGVEEMTGTYNNLVNSGMPAEEARGLMPTNIITRVNYITNLRGLLDHAGNRLCTQAQFEWRLVFAQIVQALREYGRWQTYRVYVPERDMYEQRSSGWQYDAIAAILQPVCYQTGKCEFMANFDRACSIRNRVQANHEIGRASSEWGTEYEKPVDGGIVVGAGPTSVVRADGEAGEPVFIGAISPREWLLDHAAARVKS